MIVVAPVVIAVALAVVYVAVVTASVVSVIASSISHSRVCASVRDCGAVVVYAVYVPRPTAVPVPAVCASVRYVSCRTREIEVRAVRIVRVDAEMPVTVVPEHGTEEIACSLVCGILPVIEYVAEVYVTLSPWSGINVTCSSYLHQVVEVYLVCGLILLLCEVQLVSHLVCQEQSLLACLCVCHSLGCGGYC